MQVWARAQRLEWEPDSFNGFLLSMLAAHLAVSGTVVSIHALWNIIDASHHHRRCCEEGCLLALEIIEMCVCECADSSDEPAAGCQGGDAGAG